jgi:hypothetical protein
VRLEEFRLLRNRFQEDCADVLFAKNKDYASDQDVTANFKRLADRLGVSPMVIWSVYFTKHIDAILSYVKNGQAASEPIDKRFVDAANYLVLGMALIGEEEKKIASPPAPGVSSIEDASAKRCSALFPPKTPGAF